MKPTLAFKINRRQIAIVAVADGDVKFMECRYLRSNRDAAKRSAVRFVERLALQLEPVALVLYAPTPAASTAAELSRSIQEWAVGQNLPLASLTRERLYSGMGLPAPRTTRSLIGNLKEIWPEIENVSKPAQRPVAEAASAALLGEVLYDLQPRSG